jgi:hypothetical protein
MWCSVAVVRTDVSEELGSYNSHTELQPQDVIVHSHGSESYKSYIALTGWDLLRKCNVFPVWYELDFYILEEAFFIVTTVKTSNLTQH